MKEESPSRQAIASVPLCISCSSGCVSTHTLMKLPPQAHLFPVAACPFLEKQTPHAPVSSFSHLSPPLPSSFSICSTSWFSCSLMSAFLSLSFFPLCPLWTGCDGSDGLLLWESREQCFVVSSRALLWLEQEITSVLLPTFPPVPFTSKGFTNLTSYPAATEFQQPIRRKAAGL